MKNLNFESLIRFVLVVIFALSFAGAASAQRVRLRAQVTPACTMVRSTTSQWRFADIYADGNIAVQGSYGCNGAFIYDLTNPDAPVLASWYNPGNNQQFLEAIVVGNRGYFYPLTVLADVPGDARAMREEPFGPLALLSPVKTVEEAIEKANSLPYGLAAYAFTHAARNVDQLAEGLEVGNLSINHLTASIAETPFGGVKESGYGREGGTEGLLCYTVAKNVSHLVL